MTCRLRRCVPWRLTREHTESTTKPLTDPNRSALMVEGEGDPWKRSQALGEQHMLPVLFLTLGWNSNFLHVTLQVQEREIKLCETAHGKQWKSDWKGGKANRRRQCVWSTPPQTKPGTWEHGESWAAELSCPVLLWTLQVSAPRPSQPSG